MKLRKKQLNKLKKALWGIKAFCGSAGLTLIVGDYKWFGISVALIGAAADMTFDIFFKEEDTNDTAESISGGRTQ